MFGRMPKKINNTKYYEFKELSQAYEVLNDPEKREIYDQYGEDALKEGMGGGSSSDFHSPFDIFEQLFQGGGGFGGGSSRGRRQKRGDDVVHTMKVSLEDLYNGTTKKLSLSRNALCKKCKGKESKSGAAGTCHGCRGAGMRTITRQIGLGMIQWMNTICPECEGSGEMISDKDKCPSCKGSKVTQEKVLEVHIEKGMQHGQKIVFQGEADEAFVLINLDGRQLLIKSDPGEDIKPGQHKAINDEGMPQHGRPFMKGRLFVEFNVEFPEHGSLTPAQCRSLEKILPQKPGSKLSDAELDQCEETTLHDVNMEEEMRRKQQQRQQEAYDEDEEEEGQPRVQCAQQ
ncbi:hypothetical protein PR202_gb09257 [Eleusine coracana subsp. coracana]|uniref:DnaJ-like protein n=1 Tax=Eleusine coracana subsp. coracana TaxID=191504 RepID=A0AAV5EHI7_ELECO|nr:hypothetical protein PR202_gb09257 [Eleusine coracana subsp. coracana]